MVLRPDSCTVLLQQPGWGGGGKHLKEGRKRLLCHTVPGTAMHGGREDIVAGAGC